MKGINIKIKLTDLELIEETAKRGKSSPYLWGIFFKIDGYAITITPQFRLEGKGIFNFSKGSHGNLGVSTISSGQTIQVPADIGEWKVPLEPFHVPHFEQKVPSVTGLIVVLMEKNNLSYEGAEAGHQAMNRKVEYAVNQALREFDPKNIDLGNVMPSIQSYFENRLADFTKSIKNDITNAVKNKQHLIRNILSYFNPDNLIGQHVWNFNQQQIMDSENQTIDFSHLWKTDELGDWKIKGQVTVIDDDVAQQDKVEVTEGKVAETNITQVEEENGRRDMGFEF